MMVIHPDVRCRRHLVLQRILSARLNLQVPMQAKSCRCSCMQARIHCQRSNYWYVEPASVFIFGKLQTWSRPCCKSSLVQLCGSKTQLHIDCVGYRSYVGIGATPQTVPKIIIILIYTAINRRCDRMPTQCDSRV